MISIHVYSKHVCKTLDISHLQDFCTSDEFASSIIWIDLFNPEPSEETLIFTECFSLHPLAIEDCTKERNSPQIKDHYPKVEDYFDYLFIIFNPVDIPLIHKKQTKTHTDPLLHYSFPTRQLNTFLGPNWLITHHYESSTSINNVLELVEKSPQTLSKGPDYLFHVILDNIVDNINPVIEFFEDQIDELELTIFQNYKAATLFKILSLKKGIITFRKITTYQREILNRLARGEFSLISSEEMLYYRNAYDHLVRVSDLVESYRESIAGLLEAYLSVNSNRMNQVMKVLTVISTIFLPLTFLSSIYGMNFKFFPELEWRYGYYAFWMIIIMLSAYMLHYFKRKGWMD